VITSSGALASGAAGKRITFRGHRKVSKRSPGLMENGLFSEYYKIFAYIKKVLFTA